MYVLVLHGVESERIHGVNDLLAIVGLEAVAFERKLPFLRFGTGVNVLDRHTTLDRAQSIA